MTPIISEENIRCFYSFYNRWLLSISTYALHISYKRVYLFDNFCFGLVPVFVFSWSSVKCGFILGT